MIDVAEELEAERRAPPKRWRNWYQTHAPCTSTCHGCGAVERFAADDLFTEHCCQEPYRTYDAAETAALKGLDKLPERVRNVITYLGPRPIDE